MYSKKFFLTHFINKIIVLVACSGLGVCFAQASIIPVSSSRGLPVPSVSRVTAGSTLTPSFPQRRESSSFLNPKSTSLRSFQPSLLRSYGSAGGSMARQASLNSKNSAVVGTLQGKLNVTTSGAATYSIPIDSAPGTDGMKPEISITYNSEKQDGLLGMGFSLQGLTAITRTAQNKAQNGAMHSIDFTNEDRFALDGDQLVATGGAAYGADGTTYHLYETDFTKITSLGVAGNGPAKFKVETKGGEIAYYGYTADSQIKLANQSTVEEWALNKIEDHAGNYINISYLPDPSNGVNYPQEIDYTGNATAGVTPYNKIQFVYEDRTDLQLHYHSGFKVILNKRLKEIKVLTDGVLTYDYHFNYDQSPNTARSRLTSVQKCDGSGDCLTPTTFQWQTNEKGWQEASQYAPDEPITVLDEATETRKDNGVRFIDINGDGKPEMLYGLAGQTRAIWTNNGSQWVKSSTYQLPADIMDADHHDSGVRFVDLTGNGLLDLVTSSGAWTNNGNNWIADTNYTSPATIVDEEGRDQGARFTDINGDGLVDLIAKNDTQSGAWINSGTGWTNTPAFVPQLDLVGTNGKNIGVSVLDFKGNGLTDIIRSDEQNYHLFQQVWVNTGSTWTDKELGFLTIMPITIDGNNIGKYMDINGDGLPDMVRAYYYPTWTGKHQQDAQIDTGINFRTMGGLKINYKPPVEITTINADDTSVDHGVRFVDYNGDGLPDIVEYTDGGYPVNSGAWFNTGHDWQADSAYTPPVKITDEDGNDLGVRFVDLDGNGIKDIVYNDGVHKDAWLNKATKFPDYLTGVTNGLGEQTSIDYEPLTNANVYTKEHNATYPNYDLQKPVYVVYQTSSAADVSDPSVISKLGRESNLSHITTYHYTGAKENHLGWEFLGFHKITKTDNSTGIYETTTYSQNPNDHTINKILTDKIYSDEGVLLSSTQNHWNTVQYGDGSYNNTYYYLYTDQVIKKHYSLAGNLLNTQTVTTAMDTYGNPTSITDAVQDDNATYTTQTTNTYQNDTTNWLLGELTSAVVTHSATNAASTITRTSTFSYDANGMLQQTITEPENSQYGLTTTYLRDAFGNITKKTISGQGIADRTTNITYDSQGRFITAETNSLGQTISQVTDPKFGEVTQTTDLNGLKINFTYNGFGQLVTETRPDEVQTTKTYGWQNGVVTNGINNVPVHAKYYVQTQTKDSVGKHAAPTTTVYYDELNRAVAESTQGVDGTLIWKTKEYDELGRVTKESLPYYQGSTPYYSQFTFDELGRVIKTTHPDETTSVTSYNGYTTTETNQLGQQQTKITNSRGKTIESIDYNGAEVIPTYFQYDAIGNLIKTTDSAGNIVTTTYDNLGYYKTSVNDPDKGTWHYEYNVLGELTKQTSANNKITEFAYDNLGRLTSRTDNAETNEAVTSTWQYDTAANGVGKLASINGVSNKAQNKAKAIDLINATRNGIVSYTKEYTYDSLSRPESVTTNINGQDYVTTTRYDDASRPLIQIYPDQNILQVYNTYNARGYLITISNMISGKVYWHLDSMNAQGHVTAFTRSNGMTTHKSYDPATGYLTGITTLPSSALTLQRALLPALRSLGARAVKLQRSSEAVSSRTSSFPPVLSYTEGRRRESRPSNTLLTAGSMSANGIIQSLTYQYDALGNTQSRTDDVNNKEDSYQYDNLNRITSWTENGYVQSAYQYNDIGNLTYKTNVGHYHYDNGNSVSSFPRRRESSPSNNAGPHAVTSIKNDSAQTIGTFQYDSDGNQTQETLNGNTRTISYTSYEKPLQINAGNNQVNFYYNADRTRFERVDHNSSLNETTTTLYLGNYALVTMNDDGIITTEEKAYVAPDTLIVRTANNKNTTDTIYELLKDNVGSTTAIADEDGNIINSYSYTPFGAQTDLSSSLNPQSTIRNPLLAILNPITHHGFTGQEEVESMNLIHMNGRMYNPALGRFLSADPFVQMPDSSQDLNRYSYCLNNPLAFTDSSGYSIDEVGVDDSVAEDDVVEELFTNEFFINLSSVAIGTTSFYNPGAMLGWSAWMSSASASSAFSGAMTLINGGDIGGVLNSVAINLITGASKGAGTFTDDVGAGINSGSWSSGSLLHTMVSGGLAESQGGDFSDGFIANATGQATNVWSPIKGAEKTFGTVSSRTATAAIVGGTASAIMGGDFSNGANTAAYERLYNSMGETLSSQMSFGNAQQQQMALATMEDTLVHPMKDELLPLSSLGFELPGLDEIYWGSVGVEGGVALENAIQNSGAETMVLDNFAKDDFSIKDFNSGYLVNFFEKYSDWKSNAKRLDALRQKGKGIYFIVNAKENTTNANLFHELDEQINEWR